MVFPFFIMVIMTIIFFSFINCLYCDYCYCGCFKYNPNKKSENYFNKLFLYLAISSTFYIGGGVLNQYRMNYVDLYIQYTTCQLLSNSVYQVITGVNLTNSDNKGAADLTINWSGLNYLNSTFTSYYQDLVQFRTSLVGSTYLGENDYVNEAYQTLQQGINNYTFYTQNNSFQMADPNGQTINKFKLNYVCGKCKTTNLAIEEAYNEINQTLYKWQSDISVFRTKLFDELVSTSGWTLMKQQHDDVLLNIRIAKYKTYKFYNIVMDNYSTTLEIYHAFKYTELICFIINAIFIIGGIIGYRLVNNSIKKFDEKATTLNYKGAAERENQTVKNRWIFHLVINCNMLTSILLNGFSFIAILIGVFVFEGGTVMQDYFYNNGLMHNFTFIPHGDLMDLCVSQKQGGGTVNNYFNFVYFYNYHKLILNQTAYIIEQYSNDLPNTNYQYLQNYVQSMALNNFYDITNNSIIWDNVNEEQINYFLLELPSYKYIPTPPDEFLQQYTDWNYTSSNNITHPNFQRLWCSNYTSFDIWTDSFQNCLNNHPNTTAKNAISPVKDGTQQCYNIMIPPSSGQPCADNTLPNCYVSGFMVRYSGENDFANCNVPVQNLAASSVSSSQNYFIQKINSLLTYSKYEDILRSNLNDILTVYKNNFQNLIDANYQNYKIILRNASNFYISLQPNFDNFRQYFNKNENQTFYAGQLDKIGILKNSNCSFWNNQTKVFLFSKSLLGEEFFGMSILLLGLTIFLFINGSLTMLTFFNLRTNQELAYIKNNLNNIDALEAKEKKFFYATDEYIETNDRILMGIDEIDKPNFENKSKRGTVSTFRKSLKMRTNSIVRVHNFNVQDLEENKKYEVIANFIKKQEKERDKRFNAEKKKKIEDEVIKKDDEIN